MIGIEELGMFRKTFLLSAMMFLWLASGNIFAQDFGFGFGDDTDNSSTTGLFGAGSGNTPRVSISGEASASLLAYANIFSDGPDHAEMGDIFSGKLNFSAGTSIAEAFINLNLTPSALPIDIDEAFIRAYFGNFDVEAGLRKLTWGKADSFGPLDVINPLSYSELTDLRDLMNFKISRPLLRLSYHIGSFSKIEGVFVPVFEPMRFATEGRWVQSQMEQLYQLQTAGVPVSQPNTSTLNYAQAGMRFTTTIGSSDIGAQYYYGRLTRPSVSMSFDPVNPSPAPAAIHFAYNPYHQIGMDWAQDLFGFNIRAEFAANITGDLNGDDGSVYNPHLAWSFGFDRDLVSRINLNIQCNETIRLANNRITNNPMLDIEADTDMTSTQIIAALTRTFLRDKLELRAAVFWQIEARDFMIVPSLVWTNDDLSIELSGGIFGGDRDGQFGQYHKNSFIKTVLTYSF
jgi:hypothetical protein